MCPTNEVEPDRSVAQGKKEEEKATYYFSLLVTIRFPPPSLHLLAQDRALNYFRSR